MLMVDDDPAWLWLDGRLPLRTIDCGDFLMRCGVGAGQSADSDHRYSPPTGGGLIFSTAILHEAAPVTAGVRYVLLTFFHGDAAEVRRRTRG